MMSVGGVGGCVGGLHDGGGGVLERGRVVMDGVMHWLCVHLHYGLWVGHHLTEAGVALGQGRSHSLHNGRRMVGQGVGGSVVDIGGGGRVVGSGVVHQGGSVLQGSRGRVVGAGVREDGGGRGRGREGYAEDLEGRDFRGSLLFIRGQLRRNWRLTGKKNLMVYAIRLG